MATRRPETRHPFSVLLALVGAAFGSWTVGCSGPSQMMPTPNVYARGDVDPFLDVPPALQTNVADVLFLTDRTPEADPKGGPPHYGVGRSRSVAFGVSQVKFGENVSWADLVAASRAKDRGDLKLPLSVVRTTEIGRFPPTPRTLIELHKEQSGGKATGPSAPAAATPSVTPEPPPPAPLTFIGQDAPNGELDAAEAAFHKALVGRLAQTRVKEVYLFVHGYNNTFDDAVQTIAQLWHFFGREGVPIAYSWPAGASGLLRGYTRDSESSEFTVFHLKQALRLIAACPQVTKVHVLGHSRGTAVVCSALRDLHLEIAGSGRSTRDVLKLGTLVLAAPDLDVDTVIQRMSTVRLGQVPERFAMYICDNDKALGISNWLVGGASRLGTLKSDMFAPAELELMRTSKTSQIIEARVTNSGAFGHDYFHSNPAVSSDLILLMRYQLPPGAEYGRPLRVNRDGFWTIDDDYPAPAKVRADTPNPEAK